VVRKAETDRMVMEQKWKTVMVRLMEAMDVEYGEDIIVVCCVYDCNKNTAASSVYLQCQELRPVILGMNWRWCAVCVRWLL
jgi:hypothetical protein